MRRKLSRWWRCRKYRPGLAVRDLLAPAALVVMLAVAVLTFGSYAMAWRAIAEIERRDAQAQRDRADSAEIMLVSCLNGGAAGVAVETLPSGQRVAVFTECARAKEKIYD